ncbi:hypothetical protein [Thalassobaculum sp.]|uniref:hypothetical protein n=1 Tax=Thalassobaculum sp. TaxID=2022740 RepID=UPI0032ED7F95
MTRRFFPIALAALVAVSLSACSSKKNTTRQRPAEPAPQLTLIEAAPTDARCRAVGTDARRDSQPAPLSIDPRRLGFPVEVTCEAPGFFATTETLYPRLLPEVLRSLSARAPISPMADRAPAAGAPAESMVPFRITVALRARFFETPAAREAFYDALRRQRELRWTDLRQRAEAACLSPDTPQAGASATSPPEICRRAYAWLEEQRAADLRRLEIDRRRASFR